MTEPQPIALTTWPRPPNNIVDAYTKSIIAHYCKNKQYVFAYIYLLS